jgi:hypothetical protein
MVVLRPHTPKHIRGGRSHYSDTSEPIEVMGLKIRSLSPVRVSNQRPFDHWPNTLTTALTGPTSNKVGKWKSCHQEREVEHFGVTI